MKAIVGVFVVGAVACSGSSKGPPRDPQDPEPMVERTPPPELAAAAPSETPPVADAGSAAPPADTPPTILPKCAGAKLDLRDLVASDACVSPGAKPRPLPPEIAISFEPRPLKVKSGAQKPVALVLTNTGKQDSTLVLDQACGRILEVTYEMLATNGDRVDLEEGGCGAGRGCGQKVSAFSLKAGGQLRLEFPLVARVEKFDADCKSARVKPVPKGTYDLKVYSGLAPDQSTKITIE